MQVLDVHHNCLSEIPSSLGNCEALEELNLGFNRLSAIPEAMGLLLSLRVLKAHLNKLTYLPRKIGKLGNLVELDVHYNALESLPESIGQLTSLQKLNVSANHFALKTLPESLGQLTGLVELDISENHIKVLPKGMAALTNLKVLRMDGNPWQFPPPAVVEKGLQVSGRAWGHAAWLLAAVWVGENTLGSEMTCCDGNRRDACFWIPRKGTPEQPPSSTSQYHVHLPFSPPLRGPPSIPSHSPHLPHLLPILQPSSW